MLNLHGRIHLYKHHLLPNIRRPQHRHKLPCSCILVSWGKTYSLYDETSNYKPTQALGKFRCMQLQLISPFQIGGAFAFAVSMLGWYIFMVQVLASVDFPFDLPIGDLTTVVKGAQERRQRENRDQNV